jgi:hypothetical protein
MIASPSSGTGSFIFNVITEDCLLVGAATRFSLRASVSLTRLIREKKYFIFDWSLPVELYKP